MHGTRFMRVCSLVVDLMVPFFSGLSGMQVFTFIFKKFISFYFSTEKEIGCMEQAHDSIVWSLSWHPLGHILTSGSNDHSWFV